MNIFRLFSDFKRRRRSAKLEPESKSMPCPICSAEATYLDTVDFNKACTILEGIERPLAGIPVHYFLCDQCGFCFAPEIAAWQFGDFQKFIYNDDYESVDPDYKSARPLACAAALEDRFGGSKGKIRHLDYGGGSGLLSKTLQDIGWNSTSYDPFYDSDKDIETLGTFNLITSYEVFEHVPDGMQLVQTLKKLCEPNGLILFSTLLSDGFINRARKVHWWYAAPRNGHISLYSSKSLMELMKKNDLNIISFSENLHAAYSGAPDWAAHVVPRT